MSKRPRTRGRPPSVLTGQLPISAEHSPWWQGVSEMLGAPGPRIGMVLTVEEITQMVPDYPDGRRPRPRAVARRLSELGRIELVERGPNGSRSNGAKYRILPERPSPPADDVEPMLDNVEFLEEAVERMTTRRRGRIKG